jgi:hypothetical protein
VIGLRGCIALESESCTMPWIESDQAWQTLYDDGIALVEGLDRSTFSEIDVARETGGRTVIVFGHVFSCRLNRQLNAADLLSMLGQEAMPDLDDIEGAFIILEYAPGTRRWRIINDRLGIKKLYLNHENGQLNFGTRARWVNPKPQPDPAGVITFLTLGYCLADRTLFEGVSCLLPATILAASPTNKTVNLEQYWDLEYNPEKSSPVCFARELHEAVKASTSLLTPEGSRGGLLLSGGWDSRGILGAMLSLEKPPAAVITNGKSDQDPGTDTYLARTIAEDLGLNYRFCRRDPSLSEKLARQGIALCELVTDTAPEVFGQIDPQPSPYVGLDFLHKGDEVWGWQDFAWDRVSAVGQVMPTHTPGCLSSLLAKDLAAQAEPLFQSEVDRVLEGCGSDDWNEVKDYLYLKGRVCRYIFGVGTSDEEHCQVRRPLLTRTVLDVVRRLPNGLRVQKNLFLEMLSRHENRLYAYRRNHASHIADYYFFLEDLVRKRSRQLLAGGHSLDGLISTGFALEFLDGFRPGRHSESKPGLSRRLRDGILDRWGWAWYRSGIYTKRSVDAFRPWSPGDLPVQFRLWLLLELFE